MFIAIISDIHDNLVNLGKCLQWCSSNNVQKIICCGDVTNSETLSFLSCKFTQDIFLVKGNAEIFNNQEVGEYKNIKFFGRIGRFNLAGKNIGLCHEPFLIQKVIELGECDFVFYGHTHKPWEEFKNNTRTINPGTLGGVFQIATFAVWNLDGGELELKVLEKL